MGATEQVLIEKIRQLPPAALAEVEDFVDFVRAREERRLRRVMTQASEPAFARAWDNDEDAAYDTR